MPPLRAELADCRAVVFDLDGVLYQEDALISGTVQTVRALRKADVPFRFLTNTTSKSRAEVLDKLREFGFPAQAEWIYSPPATAGDLLREQQASAYLLVQDRALPDFADVRRDDRAPDYVVMGDLGDGWTFKKLNQAFQFIQQGAGLIALGMTRYWQSGGGLLLDVGPFVAALEYATGQKALVLGKPAPAFFERIARGLSLPPEQIALVGDDIRTDVGAAMEAGFLGIQVRTGKFRPSDLGGDVTPDLVLDSVADLLASG